ncbi:BUD6 [Candida margitis]|uniref:BUD6 n=1 Tax=Candida margitis TaxID=1775924 RepID=UPI002227031B|nr:BUD6 [Candida margitis]KAI5961520.1 BUD6 [Candida margitis]
MSSSSSVRSSETLINSHKRKSLHTIESCVTRLLVSTKHLLESLTQWAKQEADDKFVSDAYVKLGNDFRAATKAFTNSGIDTSDLGNVPQALRTILEAALSEAPSQENLDRFLPNIRNIIVTLLQNLKAKQARAKIISQERAREESRSRSQESNDEPSSQSIGASRPEPMSSTVNAAVKSVEQPRASVNNGTVHRESYLTSSKPQTDALLQLQNGDAMQRRASKRFSAYQYAKLTHQPNNNNGGYDASPALPTSIPKSPNISANNSMSKDESVNEPEIYVFLKIGKKTRRSSLAAPITLASIRLVFVERFAYSPGSGNFPDIYIQDAQTKVFYELEEQSIGDVKNGSLLCLNEEDSESKSINDLSSKIETLFERIEAMNNDIVKNVQTSISSIEVPAAAAAAAAAAPSSSTSSRATTSLDVLDRKEMTRVENELRVIKQMNKSSTEAFKQVLANISSQLKKFQDSNVEVSQDSNRIYMESCHSKLSDDSDALLTKVDDLQDLMEEMRKDVAQRGVRVGEKQLKHITKEIANAKKSLDEMTNFIGNEKSIWKKIWESELDKVCEEQQFFKLQDDLTNDLQEDLQKIHETYELIEQCSIEQSKGASSKRNKVMANLHIPEPGENLQDIQGQLLVDIAQLNPDHESRLEAIERAEKLRERERQLSQLNKFQEELGDFVDDNRLKKSGGIEEIENLRKQRDEENLKNSFGII